MFNIHFLHVSAIYRHQTEELFGRKRKPKGTLVIGDIEEKKRSLGPV